MSIEEIINKKLQKRKLEGNKRSLPDPVSGLIDFYSNDYLGFAHSEELARKISNHKIKKSGSTGSRLLSGNSREAVKLEKKLTDFFGSESSLVLNSGYLANLALLSSIGGKDDTIFYDAASHASIKDGIRLSISKKVSFKHSDLNDLERKLNRIKSFSKFIVVESVYSMDGDQVPLENIIKVAEKFNASIIIDEAHALGVVGKDGRGLSLHHNLQSKLFARIYTFGKGLGVHGACICGSYNLIDYLINFSRPFIYTTALPEHSIVSIKMAIDYLADNPNKCSQIKEKIALFKSFLYSKLQTTESESAIHSFIIPGNHKVKNAAEFLQKRGFDVKPILSPTVPSNSERLRVCIHNYNTDNQIKDLAKAINQL